MIKELEVDEIKSELQTMFNKFRTISLKDKESKLAKRFISNWSLSSYDFKIG